MIAGKWSKQVLLLSADLKNSWSPRWCFRNQKNMVCFCETTILLLISISCLSSLHWLWQMLLFFFTWVLGCAPCLGNTNAVLLLFLFLLMSLDFKKQSKKLLSFSWILCSFSSWLAVSQSIFQNIWVWKNTGVERKFSEISVF